jgi:hypothetical protein
VRFFSLNQKKLTQYELLPKEERILSTPIYILTSEKTMSAGESFACHFKRLNQDNNRVTLIGEGLPVQPISQSFLMQAQALMSPFLLV